VTVKVAVTPARANCSAQAAASLTPPMVVSAIKHSTGLPFGYLSVPISSAAALAMFIVWTSSDSRTPLRRPSIVGRIPIFGITFVIFYTSL